ncbi:MAG TPA: hypothetical protein VGP47_04490 [Parachlamydiaceae bacterium]|nr:hypothetical protein [Parachlamydiaceae bacterium]
MIVSPPTSSLERKDLLQQVIHDYKNETIQNDYITIDMEKTSAIDQVKDHYEKYASDECSDEEDPYSTSQFDNFLTSSQLDKISLSNIYEFSQTNDGLEPQASETIFQSLTNSIVNATYSLGKMIGAPINFAYTAYLEFKKFLWPPNWVTEKYKCSTINILEKLKELQSLSEENLNTELGKIVKLMMPVIELIEAKSFQKAHSNFLYGLRKALASDIYRDEFNKYQQGRPASDYDPLVLSLLELCRIRFEDGMFYEVLDTLMNDIGVKGSEKLSESDFKTIDNVDSSMKISSFEVNLKKLLGHINVNFDPHLQGNIPYVFDTLNFGTKNVRLMRIGTPTIEGYTQKALINEEFRGYLQHCATNHKIHLYITLQNDKIKYTNVFKGDVGGDETGRNQAIKEPQIEFPLNYFTVVLAHDSNFYKQVDAQGKPLANQNAHEFLTQFTKELLGDNTGFYFPKVWKNDPVFGNNVYSLLKFVLEVFFDNINELTRQEKQDFIQIFYSNLSLFLISYSKADNVNITCKDGIDRAGMLNSLLLKLVMMIEGRVDDEVSQRIHKVLTHSAAFWTKSQAIISKATGDRSNGRRERLLSADSKLNKKRHEIREKIVVKSIQEYLSGAVS